MSECNLHDDFYQNIKEGVEKKMKTRRKKIKRIVYSVATIAIVLCVNVTAYGLSEDYRNWLSDKLGVRTSIVNKSVESNGIEMKVVSYYRMEDTVVMLLTFEKVNGETFAEEMNIENIEVKKNNQASRQILSHFSTLSDDKKSILTMVTLDVNREDACIEVKDLESMTTGEHCIDGEWILEVPISNKSEKAKKISNINPVSIPLQDKEYTVMQVEITKTTLVLKCATKDRVRTEADILSSQMGVNVKIEYKDGSKNSDLYCVPDNKGNLMISVWDAAYLENIHQIYLNGYKLIK